MTQGKEDLAYRRDIDGLRCIAVVLVLLSHIEVPHTLGGFIGVDIFFVISGYLITGNIYRNIQSKRFSILGFYERRFRRIVPALAGVLIVTTLIAYWVFLPSDFRLYAHSLLAAFFSYSNLYLYWTKSGYFGATYSNILLHTWSLGVEEQFYLIIPLCMMLVAKRPRALQWMIGTTSALSFVAASYVTFRNRDLAFYMPYLRAWELLSGALVALGMLPKPTSRIVREVIGGASILLLALCTIFYKPSMPFPGVAALFPCAAAVVLILVGEHGNTFCAGFLSSRPMVRIGLVSYSLYLWHWPIIVLVRLGALPGIKFGTISGDVFILVTSTVCAWLSWSFIEQPFRSGKFKDLAQPRIFQLTGACALSFSVIAVAILARNGFPNRFPQQSLAISKFLSKPPDMRLGSCFIETSLNDFDTKTCLAQGRDGRNVLLFGDSHAAALWRGLHDSMLNVTILQATVAACPPTLGNYKRSLCSQFRRFIYEDYLAQHHIDAVILTERWSNVDDLVSLQPAIDWFRQRAIPVIVVGPVPEYTVPLPYLLALGIKRNDLALANRNRVPKFEQLDQELRAGLENQEGVHYASAWNAVCPRDVCTQYAAPGVPMLADVDHLTSQGSIEVIHRLQQAGELTAE